MYSEQLRRSLALVEASREKNMEQQPPRLTETERQELLQQFHPDYRPDAFTTLTHGENAGDRVPTELAALLQGTPRLSATANLPPITERVDVLIIGGGGAGAAAALEAQANGATVLLVTKLRLGDSNTVMAEGGMQAVSQPTDSTARHYLDSFGGGHFAADPVLLGKLVGEGPETLSWLTSLGVNFDRDQSGRLLTTHGGGTSRKRLHAAKDRTGAELMRVLRDEVWHRRIPVLPYTAAVELLTDRTGAVAGAVLQNMKTGERQAVCAKTVVLATGGAGQLRCQGFPTTNHGGATADGLALAYRVGAKLTDAESLQYHPTGIVFPTPLLGHLVTEKARALGAQLIDADGNAFVHPLEPRDVTAAAVIRQCTARQNGLSVEGHPAVWLDTPMIERLHGIGTIRFRLPAMQQQFARFGIDIRTQPILVYPTLHYQNGGIRINDRAETTVSGLFAAGEVTGGIHGKNRLMGNALLDILAYGRTAGRSAAAVAADKDFAEPTLGHLTDYTPQNSTPSPMIFAEN